MSDYSILNQCLEECHLKKDHLPELLEQISIFVSAMRWDGYLMQIPTSNLWNLENNLHSTNPQFIRKGVPFDVFSDLPENLILGDDLDPNLFLRRLYHLSIIDEVPCFKIIKLADLSEIYSERLKQLGINFLMIIKGLITSSVPHVPYVILFSTAGENEFQVLAEQTCASCGLFFLTLMNQMNVQLKDYEASGQYKLTKRQREVLSMLADGNSNKNIALDLGISESAVSGHLKRLKSTLNVRTIRELQAIMPKNKSIKN